jgi:hypothetical protein
MSNRANNRSRANGANTRRRAAGLFAAIAISLLAGMVQADPNDGPPRRDDRGQQSQQNQNRRDFRDSRWGDAADQRSFEARAEEPPHEPDDGRRAP